MNIVSLYRFAQENVDPQAVTDALNINQNLPKVSADEGSLNTVLGNIFLAAGAIAVLFIVIGGLRYVISAGDPKNVNQAKNTILYAVIGLVLALSAFAIVRFVLGQVE